MDSKKVLEQLLAVADKQQKILKKLAQEVAPQGLMPNKVDHLNDAQMASKLMMELKAVNPKAAGTVAALTTSQATGTVNVKFNPMADNMAKDSAFAVLQDVASKHMGQAVVKEVA